MVNRAMCYWYLSVKLLSVLLHCCSPGMWRGANDLIPVSNCGEGCWWWVSQSIVPSSQGGVQVYLMLPAVIVFIMFLTNQETITTSISTTTFLFSKSMISSNSRDYYITTDSNTTDDEHRDLKLIQIINIAAAVLCGVFECGGERRLIDLFTKSSG